MLPCLLPAGGMVGFCSLTYSLILPEWPVLGAVQLGWVTVCMRTSAVQLG